MGDGAGARLPANAKLVWTVWARSQFEAMSLYHQRQGPEPHTTGQPWEFKPYPQEWIDEQRAFVAAKNSNRPANRAARALRAAGFDH